MNLITLQCVRHKDACHSVRKNPEVARNYRNSNGKNIPLYASYAWSWCFSYSNRSKRSDMPGQYRFYQYRLHKLYEYDYVTEKPSFPGGDSELMKFINNTREYPKTAYERGIQGRVTCSFVVNADGTVSHISVIRGVEPSLNKEAIRILSRMPEWTPGKLNGHNVPTRVVWSVPFRK